MCLYVFMFCFKINIFCIHINIETVDIENLNFAIKLNYNLHVICIFLKLNVI